MRTREGMAVGARQRPTQRQGPQTQPYPATVLLKLHADGEHSITELAELFSVSRATVYREIARPAAKNPVVGLR